MGLLLGSFYVPTGIFAALSVGSYVINPDIVSIIAQCGNFRIFLSLRFYVKSI